MTVVDDDGGVFASEEKGDDDVRTDVAETTGDDHFLRGHKRALISAGRRR
jgi:hypothetical protein